MTYLKLTVTILFSFLLSVGLFSQKNEDKEKVSIRPYKKIIKSDAETDEGFFKIHKVDDLYYFEIPNEFLDREILVVSRLSGTGEGSRGIAGMKARPQQVIRWQRHENQILLRSVSYNSVASEQSPIYESVRRNNFEPVVMSFDIRCYGKEKKSVIILMNELFTTHVPLISAAPSYGSYNSLDENRSFIISMKSFPNNMEIKHVLTYNSPGNSSGAVSYEMNQSFVLLPKEPMQPRFYDERVGYFSISQTDYGLDEQKAARRQYITRWRLEPKDMDAFKRGELVEPKKPIVYYIDPSTPDKWKPYLKAGVEDWLVAFEQAGFKNAIMVKDAPTKEEDPDWTPEDVRNSVIRYVSTRQQNAMGPHVHDPRSGEIIESDILWYHNVMNMLRNWYFVQTSAVNPEARKVKFDDEVMGKLIRYVAAHEVGHTLGLTHNMGASSAYPVDSLRSPTFTNTMSLSPSIMDYARFNYVAQPEDKGVALLPIVGVYDKYAIEWGYRPIPQANSSKEEQPVLNDWILEHNDDPMYRYGKQAYFSVDPSSQTEDLGDNAMVASTYGIENLKIVVPNLLKWTNEDGKNYDDLAELYSNVLRQWERYMNHVQTNIGGVYENLKTYDQEGAVYQYVPREKQKEAVEFLNKQLFQTPYWLVEEDILRRIESSGTINRIGNYQRKVLNDILEPTRLARLIEDESLNGEKAYTMINLFDDLRLSIWSELKNGDPIDTYRRNLQRTHMERVAYLMSTRRGDASLRYFDDGGYGYSAINVSTSDVRPMARADLRTLKKEIKEAIPRFKDEMSKFHLEDALEQIDLMLNPNK
ncbi:MAG: zinc-dependent metalloprotease [Bacteroidota bacterium]